MCGGLRGLPPYLQRAVQEQADREKAIIQIMMVFSGYEYKSHPTYAQFVPFVSDAEAVGYSTTLLYRIFASGKLPLDLDQLLRQHAEHWRPAGEIVESTTLPRRLEEPKKVRQEEPKGYIRYVLHSAGFNHPTDEIVDQIYAATIQGNIVSGIHPYSIVDALVEALRAYAPAARSLEFIESMQQLQAQAGESEAELDDISQGILRLAEETSQPAKPKQKMPYYQRNKAQWWKGRRPV